MEQLKEGIYRICIPFETIYTTSFVLVEGRDCIVYDFGSKAADAETYIIPMLDSLGVNVRYLAVSHAHGDHCGAISAMIEQYPTAKVVHMGKRWNSIPILDGDLLLDRFRLVGLMGHSDDGLAIYDRKTETLISGDALQAWGIDHWKTYFTDYELYTEALNKVRTLDPHTIIASHEYEPCGAIAEGREAVAVYLAECEKAAEHRLKTM